MKPKVIVCCGSSRFVAEMAVCAWILERDEGAIAMGLHLLPWWYSIEAIPDHLAEHEGVAMAMDQLHLRKIDLASEIFVVDGLVDGKPYVGKSTSNEIAYATSKGLSVRRMSEEPTIQGEVYKRMLAAIEAEKACSDKRTPPDCTTCRHVDRSSSMVDCDHPSGEPCQR